MVSPARMFAKVTLLVKALVPAAVPRTSPALYPVPAFCNAISVTLPVESHVTLAVAPVPGPLSRRLLQFLH